MSVHPAVRTIPAAPVFDERPFPRRIGLVVLATDHTSEDDFRRLVAAAGIGVHVARIPYENPTTPENLRRMQPALAAGAALILPGEPLDAICYSCTAASVVIGDDDVAAALHLGKPGAPVVTPPLAAVAALGGFGVRRIGVLTPYLPETASPMATYFERRGFDLASFNCLGMDDDREMARISYSSLIDIAVETTDPSAEALFISCTALRAAAVAPEIERRIGRPVVTSNLASAWACLRLCGDETARPEFGRLMTLPLERRQL
ncbi:MAG TPA: ectoine utilization protein EutA [Methylomirabilota bacterium]|nr:ectoine utilization protein EutA [Methylomirabilota bacterium]